jgi:transcriptional regulator with XRE-family HTH domain
MNSLESFGSWVKFNRRALGLTQEEFAAMVFCAPITVRKIEHDQLRPSRELANLILEKVGVPPEERDVLIRLARVRRDPLFAQVMGHVAEMFATSK